ncbi:DUF1289 domain-containing protein [uncultured Paraglaciecola sp.]|uniref:DUF1289 domain-containing protein n=1 Tax=uncultured Paraglaciecola sp. TaxID=1765024 RepID=UPI0025DDCE53|nr:DUF1289 domain-containing protein [uncultured Paraglaciecola sp.]
MSLVDDPNEVSSPCVSICALNENDVCVGCYRTGDEVTRWWGMSNTQKLATIELAKERDSQG